MKNTLKRCVSELYFTRAFSLISNNFPFFCDLYKLRLRELKGLQ